MLVIPEVWKRGQCERACLMFLSSCLQRRLSGTRGATCRKQDIYHTVWVHTPCAGCLGLALRGGLSEGLCPQVGFLLHWGALLCS